jgi:hypothetical protein
MPKHATKAPVTPVDVLAAITAGTHPLCVACGLGVDSVALLVGLWRRGIRPALITFADVGNEHPETYAYLPVLNAWLRSVGFPEVTVVRRPATKAAPYRTLEENCLANATLTSLAFGGKGCSLKWKTAPQNAYRARWAPARAAWGRGDHCIVAIGYDAGPKDARRSSLANDARYQYWYPLRDWGWDREECKRQIAAAGLAVPRKSACFFCPSTKVEELAALVDEHPELADRIVAIEAAAAPRQAERRAQGLSAIEGLWRGGCKGTRGSVARPAAMTTFINERRAGRALPVLQQPAGDACGGCEV